MSTTKQLPPGNLAGLDLRKRESLAEARQEWARLVKQAAENELDHAEVERVGILAERLQIENIEQEFHRDLDAWRIVTAAEAQLADLRRRTAPEITKALADRIAEHQQQVRQLQAELRSLEVERNGVGALAGEITQLKQKHPGLFGV
jgi:nucleoid-associated protein YgaU